MSDDKERIICAANWYQDGKEYAHQPCNVDSGYVFCGRMHHNIIALHFALTGNVTGNSCDSGFLTSHDRWVDRVEGLAIAKERDQIIKKHGNPNELYSEDIY